MRAAVAFTAGHAAVAELERKHGSSHVARLVGKTETHVRHIANGRRAVGDELAGKFADVFGVAINAWKISADAPPPSPAAAPKRSRTPRAAVAAPPPSAPPPRRDVSPPRITSAVADLEATVERLDRSLEAVEADRMASPSHKAQLFNAKINALEKLARLRGEGEISEATILRSQAFRRIFSSFLEAMREHPAAITALRAAIGRLREVAP